VNDLLLLLVPRGQAGAGASIQRMPPPLAGHNGSNTQASVSRQPSRACARQRTRASIYPTPARIERDASTGV